MLKQNVHSQYTKHVDDFSNKQDGLAFFEIGSRLVNLFYYSSYRSLL